MTEQALLEYAIKAILPLLGNSPIAGAVFLVAWLLKEPIESTLGQLVTIATQALGLFSRFVTTQEALAQELGKMAKSLSIVERRIDNGVCELAGQQARRERNSG